MSHNDGRATGVPPDADNNLGRGAPRDREERIRQKRRNEARSIEQDPQFRNRRPHDLDREDTELRREGAAAEKPGVRLSKEDRSEQQERRPKSNAPRSE
ncbi:MAG TPA: hypothetical protein VJV39_18105 [Dongiaceae bacterium]|nr:hypothetical protein [Dongiaceae bacterium]